MLDQTFASPVLPLTERDYLDTVAILRGLQLFTRLRRGLPARLLPTFLIIALNEGAGVAELARIAGVSQPVMTRYIQDLGSGAKGGKLGLRLVTFNFDPSNTQRYQVILSYRGRKLYDNILYEMRAIGTGEMTKTRIAPKETNRYYG